ncbi:MAG: diaminopimelate epimerase [bacterium]
MNFTKMHGLGNDFIVVDCLRGEHVAELVEATVRLCDRHRGIGADGLILVLPATDADFRMRIINSDGSEPEMCGNGIRCFAKFLYDTGLTTNTTLAIATLAGMIGAELTVTDGKVSAVRVDMGIPRLERVDIPMIGDTGEVVDEPLQVLGRTFSTTAVSMGNPHAVTFVEDVERFPLEQYGPLVENHPSFPRKTNAEFVEVISPTHLRMRVWERGAGITQACGTGACATLVAAVLTNRAERTATVELPGGPLHISWDVNEHVYMTGPAVAVFTGSVRI